MKCMIITSMRILNSWFLSNDPYHSDSEFLSVAPLHRVSHSHFGYWKACLVVILCSRCDIELTYLSAALSQLHSGRLQSHVSLSYFRIIYHSAILGLFLCETFPNRSITVMFVTKWCCIFLMNWSTSSPSNPVFHKPSPT